MLGLHFFLFFENNHIPIQPSDKIRIYYNFKAIGKPYSTEYVDLTVPEMFKKPEYKARKTFDLESLESAKDPNIIKAWDTLGNIISPTKIRNPYHDIVVNRIKSGYYITIPAIDGKWIIFTGDYIGTDLGVYEYPCFTINDNKIYDVNIDDEKDKDLKSWNDDYAVYNGYIVALKIQAPDKQDDYNNFNIKLQVSKPLWKK